MTVAEMKTRLRQDTQAFYGRRDGPGSSGLSYVPCPGIGEFDCSLLGRELSAAVIPPLRMQAHSARRIFAYDKRASLAWFQ